MSVGLAQSRFGSVAFALSFAKTSFQNLLVFKANEWPQSLSYFGF